MMNPETFKKVSTLKDIATVCSLNNKSTILYEDGKFIKHGEPTEAALKVFSEKLGQYDSEVYKLQDYTKNPTVYGQYLS
jgi:hypothetical protein